MMITGLQLEHCQMDPVVVGLYSLQTGQVADSQFHILIVSHILQIDTYHYMLMQPILSIVNTLSRVQQELMLQTLLPMTQSIDMLHFGQ